MLKKKELIALISILSIIIISFLSLRLYIKSETSEITKYPSDSEPGFEKIYQEEFERCMTISQVYQCIAYVTDNINLCNKWVELANSTEDRDGCIDGYVLFKKIALEKTYPCDKMRYGNMKLICQAIKMGERSYCNLIEEDMVKGLCISIISNEQLCEELIGESREDCQEVFKLSSAFNQNKIKMCELLKNKGEKTMCKALISSNSEICKEGQRDVCKNEAKLIVQGLSDAKNLDMGANKRNLTYCMKIVNRDRRNSCISVANNDLELCKQIDDEYSKFYCIIQIAEIRNNFDLCNLLVDKEREKCIAYFGKFF